MFNLFSIDDTLSGPLSDDCDICMYDISVKNETGSGKNKSVKNIFNGIFLTKNVKTNFSTPIKILRNSFNPFGNEKIEMDNSEFENYFDVIGTDKILAIITHYDTTNLHKQKNIILNAIRPPQIQVKSLQIAL